MFERKLYLMQDIENKEKDEQEIEFIDYDEKTVENIAFSDDVVDFESLNKPEENKGKRIWLEIWSYIKMLAAAAVLAIVINTFIIINANVPTGSMENTIMTGSRIIGSRLSYIFSGPERGDIAVFKYPLDESINYVKRVIGLPGETVKIIDGEVYIYKDGNVVEGPLKEPYLKEEWTRNNTGYTFEVPEDCYLMLGDNRNWSADAREWKKIVEANPEKYGNDLDIIYVKKDNLVGKVFFIYWHDGLNLDWIDGQDVEY